ncbi:hypothetical protein QEG23_002097 [Stenotrophomonas maltophilia]|uniref:Large polyvalent protein associated domain-containing protein n=1 Tax=Stenotrophomonas maltophilia TaxID=40324 RepID=A0AAI9C1W0_STEMA|nr:hypothetical protein [Stenotrophomonas maltophilia]
MNNPYSAAAAALPDDAATKTAPTSNPYAEAARGLPNDTGRAVVGAGQFSPDAIATAQRQATSLGVPADVLARNPEQAARMELQRKIDGVRERNPALADWLADPRQLGLVKDEVDGVEKFAGTLSKPKQQDWAQELLANMVSTGIGVYGHVNRARTGKSTPEDVESSTDVLRSLPAGAVRGIGMAVGGVGETYNLGERSLDRGLSGVGVPSGGGPARSDVPIWLRPGDSFVGTGQYLKLLADWIAPPKQRQTFGTQVAEGVGQVGPMVIQSIYAPQTLPASTYGMGVDQMADAVREKGAYGTGRGDLAIATGGLAQGALERLGIERLVERLPPNIRSSTMRYIADISIAAATEGATEAGQQVAQNAALQAFVDPKQALTEGVADNAAQGGAVGAIVRALLGIPGVPRSRTRAAAEQMQNIIGSQDTNAELAAATQAAAELKLGARSPDDMRAIVRQLVGEDSNLYLDAEQAQTLFQSAPQVLQDLVGGQEALAEQMATGQITISKADWMAAVPQLSNWSDILQHTRTTPEGLSPAEVEGLDVEAIARELGVQEDGRESADSAQVDTDGVRQAVLAQLAATERYTPAQADSQARLWQAVFGRLGEVTGQDPMALYERYSAGIQIADAPVEGGAPRTLMQRGIDALRSLFGRPQVTIDGRGQQTIEREGNAYVQRAGQWLLADDQGQARDFLTLDQARIEAERTGGEIVQDDPIEGQRQTWSVALPDTAAREVLAGDILFQGGAAPRGQIQIGPDRAMQISLFKGADLSTFLHESGHFFLEVYRDLATAEDAAPQIRSDLDTLLKWFGVESADQIGVDQHEQFARGFEAYLGEGRAPTPELQSVFSQFKQWILGVYRSLRNLDVELTDEVRGVFDRMLASQEEIEAAQARVGFEPIARDLAEAQALGMTERQFADYQAQVAAAREQAEADLMAQLQNADARARKQWWKEELVAVRREVASDLNVDQTERLARALSGAETFPDGTPIPDSQRVQLDRESLVEGWGESILPPLKGLYRDEGGVSPEMLAPLHGFDSANALVDALASRTQLSQRVREDADARMRERHGDPMIDGSLPEKALEAVHNSRRIRLLERELAILANLAEQPRPNRRELKAVAEAVIDRKSSRQLRPNAYLAAERNAARAATAAATKGRFGEALLAKRQQALNAALYRSAIEAQKRLSRIERAATQLTRTPGQERLAKAGSGFLPQVNGLLAAYGFGKEAPGDSRALADWVEGLQDSGEVTAVGDSVIARLDSPAEFRDVPFAEAREFAEAIKNLSHLASRQNQLLAGARKADKASAIAEMLNRSTSVLGEAREFVTADDLPAGARAARTASGLLDDIDRPESILEKLDGGETGPWHDFIWHAQEQAESKKSELMRRVGTQLKQLHAGLPKNWEDNLRQVATFKGVAMTRRRLIGMALNLGNAGNRQRLMEGGFTTSTRTILLTEGDLNSLAAMLSPTELRYVQGMWDAIGSMRPDIEALNARMGGVPIQFVEAVPFDVQMPGGEVVHMAGGYFPLAYDSTRSVVGDVQASEDAMKVLMATGAGRAATSKGYVKGRAETVKAALNLDYGLVLNRHLDQVMTDLSYREAVRDVHMLLNDPRIKNYVSSRLSPSALRSLTGGLAYSVVGSTEAAGNVAKWRALGDGLLANTTVAALALRPDIALGNYGSALVQGIDRSSTSSVLRSFAKFQTHRSELTREIVEKSPFMAAKLQEVDHMYATTIGKIRGDRWKGAHAGYTRLMMTLHRLADADVSRVVWLARYETERRKGTPDVDAVKLADKAIRMTQTATGKKDLSTFERDPALRQTRQYMGPMFVIFGRLRAATEGSGASREGSARIASLFLQWVLAPTVFAMLAGRLADDDDKDGEKDWVTWMVTEVGLFPLQTIPLVRDVASIAESLLAKRPPNARSAPLATAINNMGKATQRIAKRWDSGKSFGDSWDEYTVDLLQLAGPLVGAPSTQARKWDKAYKEIWDDPDTGALELTQMAVYGETPFYADGEVLPDKKK